MKYFVFILWIFVYVQGQVEESARAIGLLAMWPMLQDHLFTFINSIDIKNSEEVPQRMNSKRVNSPGGATRIFKRDNIRPNGWLWCAGNSTFASKPCPGDPQLEECLKVTNVSRAKVKKLMSSSLIKPDKSVKNWTFCYLSKNGIISSNGVLRQDAVLRNIPDYDKGIVEKAIDKCLYKTPHDPVETAWHYVRCFRIKLPKYAKIANRI